VPTLQPQDLPGGRRPERHVPAEGWHGGVCRD